MQRARRASSSCSSGAGRGNPPRPLRLRRERPRAGAVRDLRGGARTCRAGGSRRARPAGPRPPPGAVAAFAAPTGPPRTASRPLDFEDLQLVRARPARGNDEVRERERWRLRSIMVDEFQDTNRLQCELVDLLAGEELFFVGDEFQSIYRFRHADVEVFRERREQAGGVLALTRELPVPARGARRSSTTCSRADFGTTFQPLVGCRAVPRPGLWPRGRAARHRQGELQDTGVHWRQAEARHVARRVRELVDAGEATPGEIVLLFAAGTDAERVRGGAARARPADLPRDGRGYFGQQQVVDLLAYLRLLQNRYDDEALVTVLASPFVGVSNDALVLLRRAAGRRPLFTGLERGCRRARRARRRLFRAFRQRYERLVARARRALWLERLCEQIVIEHDYDLAVLAQWDGRRRYANLRKLARLARSYEELRGRDVEGFVRFVREQEARRCQGARGGGGGGGRGRGPPPDDPRGEGARVQGRRRRRRGARRGRPPARGDPLPAGRPLRLQGRRPVTGKRLPMPRVRGGQARPRRTPSATSAGASTTSR